MVSGEEEFQYQPLPTDVFTIRLLRVGEQRVAGFIDVTISHFVFGSIPYRCLSYMWGDPDGGNSILLNGHKVKVRKNLYDFLSTVGRHRENQLLWIDALCIDQSNLNERGHQVQNMSRIYSDAKEVLVWLGLGTPQLTQYRLSQCIDRGSDTFSLNSDAIQALQTTLTALSMQSYWKRAWIAQEIVLQPHIILLLGTSRVSWSDLGTVYLVSRYGRRSGDIIQNLFRTWLLKHSRNLNVVAPGQLNEITNVALSLRSRLQKMEVQIEPSFWEVIENRYGQECADQRDRVYALLGMTSDVLSVAPLTIDYNEDVSGLFWRACEHFGAWSSIGRIVEVLRLLGLTRDQFIAVIQRKLDHDMLFKISGATIVPFNKQVSCKGCETPLTGLQGGGIVLCTADERATQAFSYSHFVIRSQWSLGVQKITVSFLEGKNFERNWVVELEHQYVNLAIEGQVTSDLDWTTLNEKLHLATSVYVKTWSLQKYLMLASMAAPP